MPAPVLPHAAPKDQEGRPILAEASREADLALVAHSVIKACDAADGFADGAVEAVSSCRFDPASLACPRDKTATCLGERQVEALRRAFRGAADGKGPPSTRPGRGIRVSRRRAGGPGGWAPRRPRR